MGSGQNATWRTLSATSGMPVKAEVVWVLSHFQLGPEAAMATLPRRADVM